MIRVSVPQKGLGFEGLSHQFEERKEFELTLGALGQSWHFAFALQDDKALLVHGSATLGEVPKGYDYDDCYHYQFHNSGERQCSPPPATIMTHVDAEY